jgi:hypothetical protein
VERLEDADAAESGQTFLLRVTSSPSFIDQNHRNTQFPRQLNGTHFTGPKPGLPDSSFQIGHRLNRRDFNPGRLGNQFYSRPSRAGSYHLGVNLRGNVNGVEELREQIETSNA